jgi:hypothetical protein
MAKEVKFMLKITDTRGRRALGRNLIAKYRRVINLLKSVPTKATNKWRDFYGTEPPGRP